MTKILKFFCSFTCFSVCLGFLCVSCPLLANDLPTLKDVHLSGPDSLGEVRFYGQERLRWHYWDYFQSAPFNNDYDYYSSQLRLGARLAGPYLKAHAAWQYTQLWSLPSGSSAGAGSGNLYFSNGAGDNETHGTYLKYLELETAPISDWGLRLGGGRMDYSSGNQYKINFKSANTQETSEAALKKIQSVKSSRIADRLIGGFGWSEYQRSFDGVYFIWENNANYVQGTVMSPTQGGFDENAGRTLYDIDLSAMEWSIKPGGPLKQTELQIFHYTYQDARQMTTMTPRRDNTSRSVGANLEYDVDINTLGGHAVGAFTLGQDEVDYLIWGAYQYGDWFELSHKAYALALELGYQKNDWVWRPWLRVGYNRGSGDSNPADDQHETFYQMLPTARLYSSSILYNMMNTQDIFLSLTLKPSSKLQVKAEVHWIDLDEKNDRWYLGAGEITDGSAVGYATRSSSSESDLGVLLDVSATYKICSFASVNVYYGHFEGDDVVESFYSGRRNNDFFYTEFVLSF